MKTIARSTWSVILLLALGCGGGSGSSGFDALGPAERAAIERAVSQGECTAVQGQELLVCPLTTMATPEVGPVQVTLPSDHATVLDCGTDAARQCSLSLSFSFGGVAAEVGNLRVAARFLPSGSPWFVGDAAPLRVGPQQYLGRVRLPAEAAAAASQVQVALIAFSEPPPEDPSQVRLLSEIGVRYAFVAQPVPLSELP